MTEKKKVKFINVTSPAGIAIFPKLTTPDTKFKKEGEYATKLKLSAEDAQPLIDQYEAELSRYFEEVKAELMAGDGKSKAKAKALKLAADKPYKPEYDDDGNETGNIIFNFKMPARVKREGKPDLVLKPDVFDAAGKKLVKVPEIWGGSTLAVAYQLRPFNTAIGVGVSLRLQAVQVIELKQGGQRDAAGYGFGATDGYVASDDSSADDDTTEGSDNSGTPDGEAGPDNEDF